MTSLREQARHVYGAIDRQDWSELSTMISPVFAAQMGSAGPISFLEWQDMLRSFFVGFPDGHHVIEEYVVEDVRVVTRCVFEGTHLGTFRGVQPSGNRVSVGVIHIDHFSEGALAEHFEQLDALGLTQQIGALGAN